MAPDNQPPQETSSPMGVTTPASSSQDRPPSDVSPVDVQAEVARWEVIRGEVDMVCSPLSDGSSSLPSREGRTRTRGPRPHRHSGPTAEAVKPRNRAKAEATGWKKERPKSFIERIVSVVSCGAVLLVAGAAGALVAESLLAGKLQETNEPRCSKYRPYCPVEFQPVPTGKAKEVRDAMLRAEKQQQAERKRIELQQRQRQEELDSQEAQKVMERYNSASRQAAA